MKQTKIDKKLVKNTIKNPPNTEKKAERNFKFIKGVEYIDTSGNVDKSLAILKTVGNLRLVGDTGAGKTILVHKLAETLGVKLFEDVMTQDTTKWDLLGCDILTGGKTEFRNGIVLEWLLNGGMLYLDGFNYGRSGVLSLIESIADFRGYVWIPELNRGFNRSEKHYLVISFNPSDKVGYSGTFSTNIATMRRFEGLIIDYLPAMDEKRLLKKFLPNKYDFISQFVEIAHKTRQMYKKGSLRTPLTTGNLINYALLYKEGLSKTDIIEIASSLYPDDERELFIRLFEDSDEIDVDSLKNDEETT